MNIIDTLIIENLALLALMLDKYLSEDSNPSLALFYAIVLSLFTLLPLLGLMVAISYRIVRRIRSELRTRCQYSVTSHGSAAVASARQDSDDGFNDSDGELPDHMLHPQKYVTVLEINSFAGSSYGTT